MMLAAAGCAHQGLSGAYSDSDIKARIESQLRGRRDLNAKFISVDVSRRLVTITGIVNSAAQSRAIERIARRTSGADEVMNNLLVQE